MYFQSSSEWFLQIRTYDTCCLHFCQISNWNNCKSLFLSDHLTLVHHTCKINVHLYRPIVIHLEQITSHNVRYIRRKVPEINPVSQSVNKIKVVKKVCEALFLTGTKAKLEDLDVCHSKKKTRS